MTFEHRDSEIYDILKKLSIKIKTENVDSMMSNKTYERTTVGLYFNCEDGEEYLICEDCVDKEIVS